MKGKYVIGILDGVLYSTNSPFYQHFLTRERGKKVDAEELSKIKSSIYMPRIAENRNSENPDEVVGWM